jgi:hypothetical protein
MSMAPRHSNSVMGGPVSTTMFSNSDVLEFRAGVVLDNSTPVEAVPNLSSALSAAHHNESNHFDKAAIVEAVQAVLSSRNTSRQTQPVVCDTTRDEFLETVRVAMANVESAKSKVSLGTTYTAPAASHTLSREHVREIVKSVVGETMGRMNTSAPNVSEPESHKAESYKDIVMKEVAARRARRDALTDHNSVSSNRPHTTRIDAESIEKAVRAAIEKHANPGRGTQVSRSEKMHSILS